MAAKVKEKPLVEEERLDDISGDDLEIEKKSKKEKKAKKKKAKSGTGLKVFIVLVVLLIIGALVGVVGFNLFNIRDKYLASTLQKIPIVKNLVTLPETENTTEVTADELTAKINDLESQLNAVQKKLDDSNKNLDLKQTEIDRLKVFEQQQTDFKAEKEKFDTTIALSDPASYAEYYEQISPDLAEQLYPQAKAEAEKQKEVSKYLSVINEADESSSAKALEQLIPSDLDLVVAILKNVKKEKSGAILSEMSAENYAAVMKRWDPLTY